LPIQALAQSPHDFHPKENRQGNHMEISTAIDIRSVMQASGVIMAYNGSVSDDLMVTLADILKSRMEGLDDAKRSRTVFSVFMEGMQNLIWHGRTTHNSSGMVCISQQEGEITIVCGNRIERSDSIKLKETLEQLQNADKDTIRQLYREGMSRSNEHEGPGAGLGLLEIARRASHPISFAFMDVDELHVDFFLAARI
jgi:hypothetical protein